jgi:hypothetical protein
VVEINSNENKPVPDRKNQGFCTGISDVVVREFGQYISFIPAG